MHPTSNVEIIEVNVYHRFSTFVYRMPHSKSESVYEHLKFNGIYQTPGCSNSTNLLSERLYTTNRNTEKF